MRENQFQRELIRELKTRFPGCIVLKNDANYIQGIPDLLILWGNRWAALECKQTLYAAHRPNQDFYISKMDNMSFAKFICPENRKEVLHDLERSFALAGAACLPEREQVPLDQL